MPIALPTVLILASIFAAACAEKDNSEATDASGPPTSLHSIGFNVLIDPAVSTADRDRFTQDMARLKAMQINAPAGGTFEKVFGGVGTDDVVRYLNDRIHYILFKKPDGTVALRSKAYAIESRPGPPMPPVILAQNLGINLWLTSFLYPDRTLEFRFADRWVPLTSSRIGVIQLGPGYSDQIPSVARGGIFVHEGRHSDCTGGLTESALDQWIQNKTPPTICGHLHSICPSDFKLPELAGKAACDNHPWGAYAVAWIYYLELAQNCTNCTEAEKQVAKIAALDSQSRLVDLGSMTDPDAPLPDMSSSNIISHPPSSTDAK